MTGWPDISARPGGLPYAVSGPYGLPVSYWVFWYAPAGGISPEPSDRFAALYDDDAFEGPRLISPVLLADAR
jgi:hypothetical protein